MRNPAASLLLLALLSACENTGPELTPDFLDPNRAMADAPSKRTWTNPDVEMDEKEKVDFQALCAGIAAQDAQKGAAGADKGTYGELRVLSRWGKELRDQLDRDGRHVFGPKFAKLLKDEQLDASSPECGAVVQAWLGR